MKKLLILLLAVIFSCGSFVSCNNEQEGAESLVESVAESTDEFSEEPKEDVKLPPKNVVYFTGRYHNRSLPTIPGIEFSEDSRLLERFSCFYEGSLIDYLESENVSGDTYFLVGFQIIYTSNGLDFELCEEYLNNYLSIYDFLKIEGHPMQDYGFLQYLCKENIMDDVDKYIEVCTAEVERMFSDMGIDYKSINISDFYGSDLYNSDVLYCQYISIGYISADSLRKMAKETNLDYNLYVTWFPAPDDQERWLTIDYYG